MSCLVACALIGCGVGHDEHLRAIEQAKEAQRALAQEQMASLRAEQQKVLSDKEDELEGRDSMIAALEQKIQTLGGNLAEVRSDLSAEVAARATELAEAQKEIEASQNEIIQLKRLREKAESEKAQFEALTERFQSMIDAGKLEVVRRDGRMMLKLPDQILFPSGRKRLKREGRMALVEVAQVLKESAVDREFLVAGHTDNVPVGRGSSFRSNWELSTARATEVVKLLVEQGVMPESLAAAGYGEYDPIADNSTSEGREKNRRLEIILLPKLEELGI